ncbi:3-hydroxyacyl-CoA dehydrogenase [Rhizobiales bacterium]|uniref:3-hydroxyacyl-CoA dehydrogenase n=1 Tax=Hongsoonwoonella zoysiae TaxID=2821844 RepID=UPI00155FAA0D|nr:3-hydroxyacyl-CoA dehydrogenase [Hongsoonwoonella zoysiae]NRG19666.1 3-hydroxyacyl-CoA dehydrogenase [Hongsoonwoonella zoysiae]
MSLTIGIVGTGTMGRGIAQIFAASGNRILLHDAREGAAAEARDFVAGMLARLAEKGRMSAEEAKAATNRIEVAGKLEALAPCDLVIEAIVEKLEAKRELFSKLEKILSADAILATNTSSLSVTAIAAGCEKPERVAGYHFFNPVPLMKVVEVIPGARTKPDVADTLTKLAFEARHEAVRASDTPGFLVNHAGRGYVTEALQLLREQVAEPADIDRILRDTAGFRMGPFELLDLTGLDVSGPVMTQVYNQFYQEPRFRPSPLIDQRLSAGLLGRKTGEGFYAYQEGKKAEPEEASRENVDPGAVWISNARPERAALVHEALMSAGVTVETGERPSENAVVVVTPIGTDASAAAIAEDLDARRVIAVDTLFPLDRRRTLMRTPATTRKTISRAAAAFSTDGSLVTIIADSTGFVAQRVIATIVNIACDIAQAGIATPADIDKAVTLGLGYPHGPLSWGDELGADVVLEILEGIVALSGDPRYRPSPWLRRRADLRLSLLE